MNLSLKPATFADTVRPIKMTWIWIAAFVVVVLSLNLFNPLETVAYLLQNQGLGDEGASVIGFVAGYTAPLTLGFAVIVLCAISGGARSLSGVQQLMGATAVLFVTGLIANVTGFGLLPAYSVPHVSGPFYIIFPLIVATGYLTTYGFALSLCSFAIGTAIALQVERWLQGSRE